MRRRFGSAKLWGGLCSAHLCKVVRRRVCADGSFTGADFALLTRTLVAYRSAALDPSFAERLARSFPRLLERRRSNLCRDARSKDARDSFAETA